MKGKRLIKENEMKNSNRWRSDRETKTQEHFRWVKREMDMTTRQRKCSQNKEMYCFISTAGLGAQFRATTHI